ncbi:MAG: hypothetical protein JOY55_09415 [Mycobacterium sp.]|nr:hypothetical protein [Mycobacterium sp.]
MAKFEVGIPLYPGFDLLDVAGPYQTFTMAEMDCYLIGPDTGHRVKSREGAQIQPTTTFDACKKPDTKFDMLSVPDTSFRT